MKISPDRGYSVQSCIRFSLRKNKEENPLLARELGFSLRKNKEENPLLAYELGFSLRKNKED